MPHPLPHSPQPPPEDRPSDSRRPLWLRLVAFSGVISIVAALATLPGSALFEVRSVLVEGAVTLTVTDVEALAGVRPGARLVSVDPAAVARRLASDPRVAGVDVRLRLPDRVEITVRERRGVAALRVPDGFLVLDGEAVPIARAAEPEGLPVLEVEAPAPPWIRLGQPIPSPAAGIGVRAMTLLPPALAADVVVVTLDRNRDVTVLTRGGVTVKVGGIEHVAERAALLPQILAAIRERAIAVEYVDVRFGGSVVVKPAGSRAPAGENK